MQFLQITLLLNVTLKFENPRRQITKKMACTNCPLPCYPRMTKKYFPFVAISCSIRATYVFDTYKGFTVGDFSGMYRASSSIQFAKTILSLKCCGLLPIILMKDCVCTGQTINNTSNHPECTVGET